MFGIFLVYVTLHGLTLPIEPCDEEFELHIAGNIHRAKLGVIGGPIFVAGAQKNRGDGLSTTKMFYLTPEIVLRIIEVNFCCSIKIQLPQCKPYQNSDFT